MELSSQYIKMKFVKRVSRAGKSVVKSTHPVKRRFTSARGKKVYSRAGKALAAAGLLYATKGRSRGVIAGGRRGYYVARSAFNVAMRRAKPGSVFRSSDIWKYRRGSTSLNKAMSYARKGRRYPRSRIALRKLVK